MLSGNLRELEELSPSVRDHVIKALIALSKYLGMYLEFKEHLERYGIKWVRPDSFMSFLRIFNSNNKNVLEWYSSAIPNLESNGKLLLKYLLHSGLRKEEAIKSFNLIVKLHSENRLNEYYDQTLKCLCHFKYPKDFLRNTKNVYVTFITEELLSQIAKSKPITYESIRKKLSRKNIPVKINELRDYYATYLLNHGILHPEIDLLQGRIPPSIFIKHYWSPRLSELRDRTLEALKQLEQALGF